MNSNSFREIGTVPSLFLNSNHRLIKKKKEIGKTCLKLPESNETALCWTSDWGSSLRSTRCRSSSHAHAPFWIILSVWTGPDFFYYLLIFKYPTKEKCSKEERQFIWSISALCYVAAQSASAMVWLCCSRTMPNSFQNRVQQYRFSFAFTILFISFLHMSTSLSADNAPPPQRIIAYVCMNPKCDQSFTNLFSYDQHRYHSRNVGTLCASLTMRREIVATRRAGVTTSVIKRIPPKGMQ